MFSQSLLDQEILWTLFWSFGFSFLGFFLNAVFIKNSNEFCKIHIEPGRKKKEKLMDQRPPPHFMDSVFWGFYSQKQSFSSHRWPWFSLNWHDELPNILLPAFRSLKYL